jgi:AraC-like DNA-binding protein
MLEANFSIYNLLSVMTCFVGFFYAFQIRMLNKGKSKDTKYFTWFLTSLSLIVLFFFFLDLNIKFKSFSIVILLLVVPLSLLLGPLMWLYIRRLISFRNGKKPIIHFLPAIIVGTLVVVLSTLVVLLPEESIELKKLIITILTFIALGSLVFVFLIQNVLYIFLSITGYRRHKRKMEEIYSYSEEVDLSWVKILVSGYIVFIVGMVLVNVIRGEVYNHSTHISSYKGGVKIETIKENNLITGDKISITGYKRGKEDVEYKIIRIDSLNFYIPKLSYDKKSHYAKELLIKSPNKKIGNITNVFFNLIILLYIFYIGNHAIRQKTVHIREADSSDGDVTEEKDKTVNNGQSLVFKKIKEDLLDVMKSEKPYLDQDLNIFTLAKRLNTNSKYLSQVINQEFNKSFVHFVNEYRIEEAKKILVRNSNYTIEAQSQMVGFKSKSSFNIAFKRHTGITPSLFIQNNR